jgi:anti-sigma regulatory factor (Ser/Thr protein kinase)
MATVEVSFSALPAHVRTARLIATAVARRAGVPDQLLDEVRLAVGEACSRAVGLHQRYAPQSPVAMQLVDEQDRFTVTVLDRGPADDAADGPTLDEFDTEELAPPLAAGGGPVQDLLPPAFGLAVISGLVDEMTVEREGDGTRVRMTWPAHDVLAPGADRG